MYLSSIQHCEVSSLEHLFLAQTITCVVGDSNDLSVCSVSALHS